jgi:hypothetical protein
MAIVSDVEIRLRANIAQLQQDMGQARQSVSSGLGSINDSAKQTASVLGGVLSAFFDAIKRFGSAPWESLKSSFDGVSKSSKGAFGGMSDSATSAFQKIASMLPSFNSGVDKTNKKLDETGDKATGTATKIGVSLVAAFVAATAVISVFVKKGIEADAALAGLAISSGISAAQMSRFEDTALRSGVNVQDFGKSMGKLREEMAKAAAGDGNSYFDKLGIKVTDANNALLKTDDVTIEVAKKIAAMSTETEKYAAAAKLGFEGKVQVLEDIAHATALTSNTTDDQAAAVVRLGKIWHDILPGGKSMWAQISTFLASNLTPAVTEASVGILSAKNKIVDAFNQIFGTASMFPAFGEKIKSWGNDLGKWFSGVADGAANATVSLMRFLSAKTGIGNATATLGAPGTIPGIVPLVGAGGAPVVKEADTKQMEEYAALTKVIREKTEAQRLEGQTQESLTDGQKLAIKMTTDLRDGTLHLTDAQKVQRVGELNALIAIEKSNISAAAARTAATAAADKEATAYAALISAIRSGTEANRIELAVGENATAAQKERAKMDQELASGKLVLTAAHLAAARAALDERDATEALLKVQKGEKDTLNWIIQSTEARLASKAALEIEYATYLKGADVRDIANVALKNNTELEKYLNEQRKAGIKLSEESVSQMRVEAAERTRVEQAVMRQSKALGYAEQLTVENEKFAAESLFTEEARSAAILAIDAKTWKGRIDMAEAGSDARKKLEDAYAQWYANQQAKPALDEQKKLWAGLEDTAHQTFISLVDGSKDVAARLRDSFKNTFFDWLYQMTLKKWIINIGATLSGTGAPPTALPAEQTAGSAVGGALGAASGLSGLLGVGGIGGSLAAGAGWLTGATTLGGALGAGTALMGTGTLAGGIAGAGVLAGAIAPIVVGLFGASKLWSAAFGMGAKEVKNTSLVGTLTPDSVTGGTQSQWAQKGGWFRSDKSGTDTTAFTAAQTSAFSTAYKSILDMSKLMGTTLGANTSALSTRVQQLNIDLTGLTSETDQLAAISKFFADVGDTVATELVPNLAQFQQTGEALSATLQRIAINYAGLDVALASIGKAFGAVGLSSIAAREGLIAAAGGVDALAKGVDFFRQNFLTEAEQLAPVQKQVADALAAMGLSGVKTLEQFKTTALALDLTTAAGADLFARMIALSPSFKTVADAAAAAQKAAEDLAAAQLAAAAATQKAADTQLSQMLKDNASSALAALQRSVDVQKKANQKAFDELMAGIGASITEATAKVNSLQGLSSALGGGISSGAGAGPVASARAALAAAAQGARVSGVLPTADAMRDVLSTLRADNSGQFSSMLEYQRATAAANVDLGDLASITDTQLSVAQATLLALQNQQAAAQAAFAIENARLDSMVTTAQASLDKLNGIYTGVLALPEALANVVASIQAAMGNAGASVGATTQSAYGQYLKRPASDAEVAYWRDQAATGRDITAGVKLSDEARIQSLYTQYLGRAGETAGVDFYEAALAAGRTWQQIEQGFANSAEARGRAGAGDAVAAAVDALTAQMGTMQTAMARTANSTAQLADQFNNVTAGGNAMATETP